MDLESRAVSERDGNRDLDGRPVVPPDPPEGGRRAVGEHGAVGDEDRRHPGGLARARAVADGVDAAVDRVEAPGVDPIADRPPPEAEPDELSARDDSMLTRGERAISPSIGRGR